MSTTIQISDNVKQILDKMKIFNRETYNEVIENMIEDSLELSEETRRELEKARKDEISISHEEVKKLIGL
jgi:hypothetical protein